MAMKGRLKGHQKKRTKGRLGIAILNFNLFTCFMFSQFLEHCHTKKISVIGDLVCWIELNKLNTKTESYWALIPYAISLLLACSVLLAFQNYSIQCHIC